MSTVEIIATYRQYTFAQRQRIRNDNALGAYLRREFGWRNPDHALAEPEGKERDAARKAIETANADAVKRAADCIKLGEAEAAGKPYETSDDYAAHRAVILGVIEARAPFAEIEKTLRKRLEELAEQLPVWSDFGEEISGFGAKSLACIVGEAGDLSKYDNPAKLWKRLGLAVIDGRRQGNPERGDAAEWIKHGYNKGRRSVMFVIGDTLFKKANPYRDVYLARKEYLRQRAAERGLTVKPAAQIKPKEKAQCVSEGYIHLDALRYMQKRLLKDLWQAWRRTAVPTTTDKLVSADELEAA